MAMLNNQMVYTLSSGRCIPLTFDRKDVKNNHLRKSLNCGQTLNTIYFILLEKSLKVTYWPTYKWTYPAYQV
jgi:hypothetical protein